MKEWLLRLKMRPHPPRECFDLNHLTVSATSDGTVGLSGALWNPGNAWCLTSVAYNLSDPRSFIYRDWSPGESLAGSPLFSPTVSLHPSLYMK